ncbi:MAG: hypothetical protein ACTHZ1_08080 [Sphingobacterium sp.]
MKQEPIDIAKLLAKQLRYELSAAEELQLTHWINQHPYKNRFA